MIHTLENGKEIRDMSSPKWADLGHERHVELAKLYKQAYSEYSGKPVEKTVKIKGTNFEMVLIPPGRF